MQLATQPQETETSSPVEHLLSTEYFKTQVTRVVHIARLWSPGAPQENVIPQQEQLQGTISVRTHLT